MFYITYINYLCMCLTVLYNTVILDNLLCYGVISCSQRSQLLTEILYVCLPESGLPQYSPREAPESVSQVNKRWRVIALTNRRLWSRLSLRHEFKKSTGSRTGIPEADDTFSVLSALTEWLERSNPVPFSLILKFRWSEGSYSSDL